MAGMIVTNHLQLQIGDDLLLSFCTTLEDSYLDNRMYGPDESFTFPSMATFWKSDRGNREPTILVG